MTANRLLFPWTGVALVTAALAGLASAGTPVSEPADTHQAVLRGLTPAVVFAGEPEPRWTLRERMRYYHVPGLSLALIQHGKVTWSAAFGTRNAAGAPVDPSTLFQAASLSKPVTAGLALTLVQAGILDIDASVNTQLHTWQLPGGGKLEASGVTLRRLLSHDAGINIHGFPGYAAGERLPTLAQILDGLPPANSPPIRLTQAPSSGYRYSGGGYQIVQQLIEDTTGRPFEQVAQARLLDPLGMRHSLFAADLPVRVTGNVAAGHAYDGQPVPGGWNRYPELAAAALWSTPTDLARFLGDLMEAEHGIAHGPITPATAHAMLTAAVDGMGVGLGVHGEGAHRKIDHDGAASGYRTYMVGFPTSGDGLVMMTNGDGGEPLIQELCRAFAKVHGWPGFEPRTVTAARIDNQKLDRLAGDYLVREYGFTLRLVRHGTALVADTPRGSRYVFRPISSTRFVSLEDGSELTFDSDKGGQLEVWGMQATRVR